MNEHTVAAPQNLKPVERKLLVALTLLEVRGKHPTWDEVSQLAGVSRQERTTAFYKLRRRRLIAFTDEPRSLRTRSTGREEARRRPDG